MMKWSLGVHLLIVLALGIAVGCSFGLFIENANVFYGVECIVASVASVLNLACGDDNDKGEKK